MIDSESLAKYGEVIPSAPKRILKMAENQAEHRQWLEKRVISSDIVRAYAGLACAFIITMTIVVSGAYMVLHGHDLYGTIFAGIGLAGLAGTFLRDTKKRAAQTLSAK
jgi:uncharacterized membrane protein